MPRILIRCPATGEDVPTGRRTQDFQLSEVIAPLSFRCPVCSAVHAWSGADAWVETASTRTGGATAQTS